LARATALEFALIDIGVLQDDQPDVQCGKMKGVYIGAAFVVVAVSVSGRSVISTGSVVVPKVVIVVLCVVVSVTV
jgi:hypothetical protein